MSPSEPERPNDEYAWIDRYAADLHAAVRELGPRGDANRVSDESVAQLFTAAVRLYFLKADMEDRTFSPVVHEQKDPLTPTEVVRFFRVVAGGAARARGTRSVLSTAPRR